MSGMLIDLVRDLPNLTYAPSIVQSSNLYCALVFQRTMNLKTMAIVANTERVVREAIMAGPFVASILANW